MNYRIKNIDYWLQFCPQNEEIKNWKNDECHTMTGATEEEAVNFNVADISPDMSMEEDSARHVKAEPVEEKPVEEKIEFVCECGKVCKSKAGLAAHKRSCK